MNEVRYNNYVLKYEYVPIIASSNPITGMKYYTKVFITSGDKDYMIGEFDEKLNEESIVARFEETMKINQERQYGTQRTFLRKDLPRRSEYLTRR